MRSSLYTKYIFSYFCFFLISFFFVSTVADRAVEEILIRRKAEELAVETDVLATRYEQSGAYVSAMTQEITRQLEMVAESTNTRIWLLSPSGHVTFDTSSSATGSEIPDFDPAPQEGYLLGDPGTLTGQDMISTLAPVNSNFAVLGYVMMNYPVTALLSTKWALMKLIYAVLAVVLFLSLLLLLVFHFSVFLPIRKILAAVREFAMGNLSHRIRIGRRRDELRYLADTLNYMAEEESSLEKYQRDFISNISHDFRSPLTSIKGFLEAILDGTIPPELHEKYLKRVIGETSRLTKLTEEMLTLGNLDSKGLLNRSVFDINRTIRDICASSENACLDKNLHFELLFENATESVYADHEKIQRVLYNLIDNAVKFSYPDTAITISTAARQKKIYVSVKDHGVGIPRASLNKVWERFYKTDTSRGRDKQGTGLGLSIVKEIIASHNETIDVISTENVGTEFTFSLPQAESVS